MVGKPSGSCSVKPLIELPRDHKILRVPAVPCDHKHGMWRLLSPLREWFPRIGFYYGCLANELAALHNRHLIRKIEPVPARFRFVADWWRRQLPQVRCTEWTEAKVLANTPTSRKKRVERAFSDLHRYGLTDRDVKVQAFIKHEKAEDTPADPLGAKDPRMIQYRSFKFTARLQQYLLPMEHKIFKWGQTLEKATSLKDRLFAKGMNSWQVGSWVADNWADFARPRADLWDVSRFDAHMGKLVREYLEFPVYRKMNPDIAWMLQAMRKNKCRTKNGVVYESSYTMCSGEACTSSGDSLVMAAVLKYIYRNTDARILVNGDDSVVICDDSFKPDHTVFEDCGLPTKYETADIMEHVEFCQCRPVKVGGRWRMVRNPIRVLSRSVHTIKNFAGVGPYADWLSSVGVGEVACNDGVPILQQWGMYLKSHGNMRNHFLEEVMARRPGEKFRGPANIDSEARISFALAWGIMPDQQRAWEQQCREMESRVVPGFVKLVKHQGL